MHAEDIAKTVQMINNQVQQINTLTQQLQQIQSYVKAFGDPSKLVQITGADSLVSSLKSSGVGQTIGQLQQAASGVAALPSPDLRDLRRSAAIDPCRLPLPARKE